MAERAEKLATTASAASKELADKADSQNVHQDLALQQSNHLRTLEQQIGNALDKRDRTLQELQLSLRSQVEARGQLQQKVDWLLQSQDKGGANNEESLSIVAGNIGNRMQIEIDKNRVMLEQTRQHLAAQLENQRGKNASEFMKIGHSFAALKQQIDADMAQMRSHVSQVQPTSAEKIPASS